MTSASLGELPVRTAPIHGPAVCDVVFSPSLSVALSCFSTRTRGRRGTFPSPSSSSTPLHFSLHSSLLVSDPMSFYHQQVPSLPWMNRTARGHASRSRFDMAFLNLKYGAGSPLDGMGCRGIVENNPHFFYLVWNGAVVQGCSRCSWRYSGVS